MKRQLVMRPQAEADIAEAYNWHKLRGGSLGDRFLHAVDAALAAIERNPLAYQIVHKTMRHALLRGFSYALYFAVKEPEMDEFGVETQRIVLLACVHTSQDPYVWQQRADD